MPKSGCKVPTTAADVAHKVSSGDGRSCILPRLDYWQVRRRRALGSVEKRERAESWLLKFPIPKSSSALCSSFSAKFQTLFSSLVGCFSLLEESCAAFLGLFFSVTDYFSGTYLGCSIGGRIEEVCLGCGE